LGAVSAYFFSLYYDIYYVMQHIDYYVTSTKNFPKGDITMSATEPIRDKAQIRNYVLIVIGVHTALRISDLLRLTWDDVYDFERNRVRETVAVTEKKTGKRKIIALNAAAVKAIELFAPQAAQNGRFLIENPQTKKAICRVQAYRIIRAAAEAVGIGRVPCHSLRKTFGYHAWKNGVSPAVIMEIYNHSSFAVTRRYLGVTQDDKNEAYLFVKLLA
jgi:integrase